MYNKNYKPYSKVEITKDPNIQNGFGHTSLMILIIQKSDHAFQILDNPNLNLDIQDLHGNTALMIALNDKIDWDNTEDIKFNTDLIYKMLNKKFDINIQNDKNETALMIALSNIKVDEKIIQKLLDLNPDPNLQDNNGNTILMIALKRINKQYKNILNVTSSYRDIDKILNNKKTNIDVQNMHGITAFMTSLKYDVDKGIVNKILKKSPNVNLKDYNENTAIYYALKNLSKGKLDKGDLQKNSCDLNSFKEWCSIIFRIIKNININLQDKYGSTPLMLLIHFNAPHDLIKYLLNKDPDINIRDKDGNNTLMVAIHKLYELSNGNKAKMYKIIQKLLDKKPDVNIQNNEGYSAVTLAMKYFNDKDKQQNVYINKILNKMSDNYYINVNSQNNNGETPIMLYFNKHNKSHIIEKMFDNKNLNVNILDNEGRNVLMRILKTYNEENLHYYVDKIINKGVNINTQDMFENTALYYALISNREPRIINRIMEMKPLTQGDPHKLVYEKWIRQWIEKGDQKSYINMDVNIENYIKKNKKNKTIFMDGIKIYRGLKWHKNNIRDYLSYIITDVSKLKKNNIINVKFTELSSWTTDYNIAKQFSDGEFSIIFSMTVDIKDILLDNFNDKEREIILKPGKYKCKIEYTNITNNINKEVSIDN